MYRPVLSFVAYDGFNTMLLELGVIVLYSLIMIDDLESLPIFGLKNILLAIAQELHNYIKDFCDSCETSHCSDQHYLPAIF